MGKPFTQRIASMNAMYKLPANGRPLLSSNVQDPLNQIQGDLA
jgi:hypothetical protein